jgi:CheY-like chemotaxis protein
MDKLLSGRRLLVVEDEMMVLLVIEDMLADLGCLSVTAAASVEQALALIDAQTFDIAMLDVNLNGTKSYPVADILVARKVPFFFATGYGRHGLDDGYQDQIVLQKPYRRNGLVAALTELLVRQETSVTELMPLTMPMHD